MAMKNDYSVIIKDNTIDLAEEVVKALNDNYILIGGVSISYNTDEKKMYFAQAINSMPTVKIS